MVTVRQESMREREANWRGCGGYEPGTGVGMRREVEGGGGGCHGIIGGREGPGRSIVLTMRKGRLRGKLDLKVEEQREGT